MPSMERLFLPIGLWCGPRFFVAGVNALFSGSIGLPLGGDGGGDQLFWGVCQWAKGPLVQCQRYRPIPHFQSPRHKTEHKRLALMGGGTVCTTNTTLFGFLKPPCHHLEPRGEQLIGRPR